VGVNFVVHKSYYCACKISGQLLLAEKYVNQKEEQKILLLIAATLFCLQCPNGSKNTCLRPIYAYYSHFVEGLVGHPMTKYTSHTHTHTYTSVCILTVRTNKKKVGQVNL
jgi:hypothetical protein